MTIPRRIRLERRKGFRLPPDAVKVDRSTKWGNPFDFRPAEYCWAAIGYGCRGDARGRQKASVRAFAEWTDAAFGRKMVKYEYRMSMGAGKESIELGPKVTAGEAPSHSEIAAALRGKNLACWCKLCPKHHTGLPLSERCEDCEPCHADVLLRIANP